jgi:TatD DNase family protein
MLVDTHCHLDDQRFAGRLPQVLEDAARAGVHRMVVPGVEPGGWGDIAILQDLGAVSVAYGVHPLWAHHWSDTLAFRLRMLAEGACAIGEIGLDYQGEGPPRELQQQVFRSQLRVAVEAGLPVIIHCRRAFRDLLTIMEEERVQTVGGIMHAFSGSVETARDCISRGFVIGVAGTVTWKNAVKPVAVARAVPLEQLVLETDSPDLTPEPLRGRPNEPAFLPAIALALAEIKGITAEEVGRVTTETARRVLGLG